jgi:hypothetical protein
MVLKFLDRPQLGRNASGKADTVIARLPPGSLPIASAPANERFVAVARDGTQHWVHQRRAAFRRLEPRKDHKDGSVRLYEDGAVVDAVAWVPQRRG